MTSIADPGRSSHKPTRLRTFVLIAVLTICALQTPMPWGGLWLIVPGAVAVSLLAAWRYGGWGVLVPVGLFVISLFVVGNDQMWTWWIPFAALTGAWMGLREEGGGPSSGDRAWMLLPLLLLAATIPWTAPYEDTVAAVNTDLHATDSTAAEFYGNFGVKGAHLARLQQAYEDGVRARDVALPFALPSVIFLWMAVLVTAGRSLSARAAMNMRWPALSRSSRRNWRLPDGALWILILGLGLLMSPWPAWNPTAWTLIINCTLGYCFQGIAVVESLLLARGLPPSVIMLTLVFVFALAAPMFMVVAAALGISDVWLDYRRLEKAPDGDEPGA